MLGTSPVFSNPFQGPSCFSDYSSNRCGNSPCVPWETGARGSSPAFYTTDSLVEQFSDLRTTDSSKRYSRTGSLRRSKKLDRLKREFAANTPLLLTNPSKSCLRQIDEQSQEESAVCLSPTKEKKKVIFADNLGKQLAQIKLITERPDCPPFWTQDFLAKLTGGIAPDSPTNEWEIAFSQPIADYISFKNKLETENVTLENVMIETKGIPFVKGTITVRNISFHKEVCVRYTTNSWASTTDVIATYVPSPPTAAAYDHYDRFSFELPLPHLAESDKLEFCIKFSCDGVEYWDNNNGKNYTVISFRSKKSENRPAGTGSYGNHSGNNWSEYASWKQEDLSAPYW